MRVLHVIARLNVGGTARYITQLAHELPKHGIETFVATGFVQGAEVEDESAQSIDLIRIPSMGRSFNPIKDHFARKQLDEIISDVRKFTSDIYPTQLKEMGFINALEQNLFDMQKNIRIRFFNQLEIDLNFDNSKELAVYRITNEVLNNILRHGRPSFLDCEVNCVDNYLQIVFTHDGIPFSQKEFIDLAQSQKGRGCSSILNRTLMLEGTVEFYRILEMYACVNIQIPMQ